MLKSINFVDKNIENVNITGIRVLVIFLLLLESPKTAEEIIEYFVSNNYPKGLFSLDTLRNDLNVLRNSCCEISKANKLSNFKYILTKHPFELNLSLDDVKILEEVYLKFYQFLQIQDLLRFESLFKTLALYTVDDEVAQALLGISKLKNIDVALLNDILEAIERGYTISFVYKTQDSRILNISIIPEEVAFRSDKLYLFGYSLTHNKGAFFRFLNIQKPIYIDKENNQTEEDLINVEFELRATSKRSYKLKSTDTIIKEDDEKIVIKAVSRNEFILIQRFLEYGSDCKILEPQDFKQKFVAKVKRMQRVYEDEN